MGLLLLLTHLLMACQSATTHRPDTEGSSPHATHRSVTVKPALSVRDDVVLDIRHTSPLSRIIPELAAKRVVYVGEIHDDYAHHLKQLEILRHLYQADPELVIGMEMFQQPFQRYLDAYIARRLSEKELLVKSEWFDRWRYDYRLYRPILQFAREKRLPVIALNLPREITQRVSKVGIEGLTGEERAQIPEQIDDAGPAYRERLKAIFESHAHSDQQKFERFMQVQLLWDEGMAERAADYLKQHPGKRMLLLAGSGHLMYRVGIPERLERRLAVDSLILLPDGKLELKAGVADFLLFTGGEELPPGGELGVYLSKAGEGVEVVELAAGGAAEKAGIKEGDRILRINGEAVRSPGAIRLELMDRSPGEKVRVTLIRSWLFFSGRERTIDLVLEE